MRVIPRISDICEVTDGLACAGEAGFGGTGRDISGRDKGLEATARGDRRRLKGIRRATWSKGIRAGRATWFGPPATRSLGPNPAETLGSTPPAAVQAGSLKGQQKESGFPLGFPLKAASDPPRWRTKSAMASSISTTRSRSDSRARRSAHREADIVDEMSAVWG